MNASNFFTNQNEKQNQFEMQIEYTRAQNQNAHGTLNILWGLNVNANDDFKWRIIYNN